MSVWPLAAHASASLSSQEGELLLLSITVEPRRLELLLDTLAALSFPVNPQIQHDAAAAHAERPTVETATLVEFPAYQVRLEEVRGVISAAGFDPGCVRVVTMLDQIHSGG